MKFTTSSSSLLLLLVQQCLLLSLIVPVVIDATLVVSSQEKQQQEQPRLRRKLQWIKDTATNDATPIVVVNTNNINVVPTSPLTSLQSRVNAMLPEFTGRFTLVRTDMLQTATDEEVILGVYKSGDIINVRNMPSRMSLIVDTAGPTGGFHSVILQLGTVRRNDTLPPYSLGNSIQNRYTNVGSLSKPGLKNLNVTGYSIDGSLIASRIISFTIINITVQPPPPPLVDNVGKWVVTSPNASVMSKRHEGCFVMVGRVGVLLGGRGLKKPQLYNPVTKTWRTGPSVPGNIELNHFQCVVVNQKVWIIGAWTGKYPQELNANHTYVFDPILLKWELKDPMPIERRRGAAATIAVGQLIYIAFGNIGGHETGNHAVSLNWFDSYDTVTNTWTILPDATYARDHTGGALIGSKICVAGGRDGGTVGWPLVAPTECYDLYTSTWSIEADIPRSRAGSSYGQSCDGKYLLVAGGEIFNQGIAFNNFDIFNGTTWTTLSSLNIPRHSTGLAVDCLCNAIYIASGSGAAGNANELQSVETFYLSGTETKCEA